MLPKLTELQEAGIARALAAPGQRWIFGDEMGLGKTRQALLTASRAGVKRLLVVCPAMARGTWVKQVGRWQPAWGDTVGVFDASTGRSSLSKKARARLVAAEECVVRVVSPRLVDVERERAFTAGQSCAIVLDEVHNYVEPDRQQARALMRLVEGHRGPVLGLTGTPIPNRLGGLWLPFSLVRPGIFGPPNGSWDDIERPLRVPFSFLNRYVERRHNGYGWQWLGMRADGAAELKFRLAHVMSRVTRAEVGDELPACQVRPLPLPPKAAKEAQLEWLAAGAAQHTALFFHRRASVAEAAQDLAPYARQAGLTVVALTGADTPAKRDDKLAQAHACERGSLVLATMHAVKESIDMSWVARGLLAELYWRPATLIQLVGRFGRPGGVPSMLDVMCIEGSPNEKIAEAVAERLMDAGSVVRQGQSSEAIHKALASSMDELMKLATSVVLDDNGLSDLEDDDG